MADNLLKVQPIRNGTVIDHLRAGAGLKILDILDVAGTGNTVSLLINVPSSKQGRKDIIKIEDRELTESETERIALLCLLSFKAVRDTWVLRQNPWNDAIV